ncbi:hypothetical protein [Euzebya rosea]|uniref:hypothetical protein n=1 Tax=Euzebya rosea TaxID=2052804 RepID=UPI000D3ECBEE|nr:hypothetical protein [Euzebya rosea]
MSDRPTDRPTPEGSAASPPEDTPDFGPGGYLPPRAAKRARKIVLRERMGLHWPVAAVVAGLLILAVVIPAVIGGSARPEAPFVNVGSLDQVDPRADAVVEVNGTTVLVVRGGGVLAAFADPPEGARYCTSSRRIESPAGTVWTLQGRRVGGTGDSLVRAGASAVDGDLYVDPTPGESLPPTDNSDVAPAC